MEKTYSAWELEIINIALLSYTRELFMRLSSSERAVETLKEVLDEMENAEKKAKPKRGRPLGSKNKARVKK